MSCRREKKREKIGLFCTIKTHNYMTSIHTSSASVIQEFSFAQQIKATVCRKKTKKKLIMKKVAILLLRFAIISHGESHELALNN